MATEKHDAWMAAQISASTHLCVATLNRISDGTQTELKGCGKYEPLLDDLKIVRLMQ